jgi:hypothetical protein
MTNPKSYRCGIIRGLLFMPTTIGNMIWGDTFLRGSRFLPGARQPA